MNPLGPTNTPPQDKTSLEWWFPKLESACLPVPRTIIIGLSEDERRDIWRVLDGKAMTEISQPFFDKLKVAADSLGYPCFLRSGQTSAKHSWKDTCYLAGPHQIKDHVVNIIEYGEMASMIGLAHDVWVLREYLPVTPIAICPNYGDMPLCREFRVFVRDAEVQCLHGYWPRMALKQGGVIDPRGRIFQQLAWLIEPTKLELQDLASKAGEACGGYWSVDLLETKRGWIITDMAEGEKSFHWEGCEHNRTL